MIIDPDTLAWLAALEILLVACLCGSMIVAAAMVYFRGRDVAATTGRLDDHSAILANLTIRVANIESPLTPAGDDFRQTHRGTPVGPAKSIPPVPEATYRTFVFDEADPEPYSARLVFDREVSETSPVIKGTWVTAAHVVSCVVDGWTWSDIVRAHPEIKEGDIRACLAWSIASSDTPPGHA